MRYTIKHNEKDEWFEVGEMTQDGQTWRKFFEMTLERQKGFEGIHRVNSFQGVKPQSFRRSGPTEMRP
jgi:hypothetical protein